MKKNRFLSTLSAIILTLSTIFSGTALFSAPINSVYAAPNNEVDFLAEYEAVNYDSYDGLVSAEINAVAQTPDGYIWVGTYSGLYRYDGYRFERSYVDKRICNVMTLLVDTAGILWIGTNDSGIFGYDPATGDVRVITTADGLSANSIRSICETKEGDLYIGTTAELSVLHKDGKVCTFSDMESIIGVRSLCYVDEDRIGGVTNSGILFFIDGEKLVFEEEFPEDGIYYTSVSRDSGSDILAGTSGSVAQKVTYKDGVVALGERVDISRTSYLNDILYDADLGGYFFCGENGMGFYHKTSRRVTYLMQNNFRSSVSGVIRDYQGNIWFVSNKQGIIKYSRNPFMDVFVKSGVKSSVVNSCCMRGSELFVGKDDGLTIIDTTDFSQVHYDFEKQFKDVRIRNIIEDSKGNMWVSTYGVDGLVEILPDGSTISYNESSAGTLGGRFRLCMELQDGTIVAASNMGLNYIRDGKVIGTNGEADGMKAPQILTMASDSDGILIAGSDGDGVYKVKDGKFLSRVAEAEGLETLVVLRIIPIDSGYIYVTSNALYYDDGNTVKRLENFPYTNNYDMYVTDSGEAWIFSSAGIFVAWLSDLIEDTEDYSYTLFDYSCGFTTSLTANSWNCTGEDGVLYLCCTDGVRRIDTDSAKQNDVDYYIRMNSLTYDDEQVELDEQGRYVIPAGEGRIQITPAVLNYKLSNPVIHMYLDGMKDEGIVVFQNGMTPLVYTNLPYGSYTFHVSILDPIAGELLRDETFTIYKKPRLMELLWFRILLLLLGAAAVAFIVYQIIRTTIIRSQYEQIRAAKDEAERANSAKSRFLANMSHEIRTPINTIMGMDEMILREDRSQPQKAFADAVASYATSIKRASESLLGLVNDILDLSKIESGKMNLVETDYNVPEWLRAICIMIRVRSAEKGLEFILDIDPEIPTSLHGDDGKIKQVILNLLTNAVKYTKEGSFTFSMRLQEKRDEEAVIHYSVSDTGIGIKPEDMDKLFSAFQRLEEERNSKIQGTGLGLDISRQFVELMGDELRCESTYGQGSTFFFTLRQQIVDPEPIGEFVEETKSEDIGDIYIPLFTAPDARILCVDDSDMNLKVVTNLLKATHVRIETAMSGEECLEKLDKGEYDVVLLDHMMPGMDGIETVHRIRDKGITLPVLAFTANSATSGLDYYKSEGFNGFIPKPVDGRVLEETVMSVIPEELIGPGDAFCGDREQSDDVSDSVLEQFRQVEGLNIDDALRYTGSAGDLLDTAKTFYQTLEIKAHEIEKAYSDGDIALYTVRVHALKSSARIMGLSELSSLAEKLEDAGNSSDMEFIGENTARLLEMYRSLRDQLAFLDESAGKREPADTETIKEAYQALTEVAVVMDYDSAEMIIAEIRGFDLPEEDRERFSKLDTMLRQLDWDGFEKLAKEGVS